MRDYLDCDDNNDYTPNDLARLQRENPAKFRQILEANLEPGDSVEKWEERNLKHVQNKQ